MSESKIRVRFAPSPTGFMHVGNARAALFNWLYAKHTGGTFILRIEDTDVDRSEERFIQVILDGLKWLNIECDEGPYFQTDGRDRHQEALEQLIADDYAYPCFETEEELAEMREECKQEKRPFIYDRSALDLSSEEVARRIEAGEPHHFRFKTQDEGKTVFDDLIRGRVSVQNSEIGDFVITREGGLHTFNFACALDDIHMKISHVIRGEDHVSNTPRQIMIMRALGCKPPTYAHLPLILGEDKARLSKRHGAASVEEYRNLGYLPDALVNFLVLLGWSLDSETELFTRDDLIEHFSIERVNSAAAVFNHEKLDWMNGIYIRERTPREEVCRLVRPFLENAGFDLKKFNDEEINTIIGLAIERVKTLADFPAMLDFIFLEPKSFEPAGIEKVFKKEGASENLNEAKESLANLSSWSIEGIDQCLRDLSAKLEVGLGKLAQPLRLALTGRTASPGIFEVIYFIGRERTVARIEKAIDFISSIEKP